MTMKKSTRRGARLGQHYLRTPWPARALARAAGIGRGDTVIEIGPGKGALTRILLTLAAKVIAIEKDGTLIPKLHETFREEIETGKLEILEIDVRDFTPERTGPASGSYVLAANIPYYITGEIIRKFLTTKNQPRTIALLVQKEVADRIVSERESVLSISVKAYGTPRRVMKVGKGNFSPPPSVDSAIIVIDGISRDLFRDISEEHFFEVVRLGFSSKRKLLVSNLSVKFDRESVRKAFEACGLNAKARAEIIPPASWKCLAESLSVAGTHH